ncbi:uncharacterized protein AB675_9083 [Cyphellophora attinorum]|uniref:Uncharacterized protein n=1 Tax=Cyphellophora attinorum TaxID=1664694 RepID=A0A0N0NNP4_9EURO|nr:uncharacterized protein AB675_9083 [Phialophora attinorum]KPI41619.1 hypothetical protein AB675_9083 [Phialophora attinorum]
MNALTSSQLLALALLLAPPSLAAIEMKAFSDNLCGVSGGNIVEAIMAGQIAPVTICGNSNAFLSVLVPPGSSSDGFVCEVYSDIACKDSVKVISVEGCQPIPGQSILCFDPKSPDRPDTALSAAVNVGTQKTSIIGSTTVDSSLNKAKSQVCNDIGCENSDVFTTSFETFGEGDSRCRQKVRFTEGNYDSAEQRDYMVSLLAAALNTMVDADPQKVGGPNGGGELRGVPNFAQVIINDKQGNNRAEMKVEIETKCDSGESDDGTGACDNDLAGIAEAALGVIATFGGFAVLGFKVVCAIA